MSDLKLLSPIELGEKTLKNRMVLAPLTRARATPEHVPTDVMADYYVQRASAGLIIVEATGISQQGMGWYGAPGIWNAEQTAKWKAIVDTVHAKGGVMCLQLWHMGRQAHSDVIKETVVGASPIPHIGEVMVRPGEKKPYPVPEELTVEGIDRIVADYTKAAKNAKEAGFDMVEVHSANGYLLDTFLQTCSNQRTDEYGGSIENRLRFLSRVVDAVTTVYPKEKVGVRLSPNGVYGTMGSADNIETFTAAIDMLGNKRVAFVEILDGLAFGFHEKCEAFTLKRARDVLAGTAGAGTTLLMGNCGYTRKTAEERLQQGEADLISFGRVYISNPDLPERFAQNLGGEPPLNDDADRKFWWTHGFGAEGYTTYPTLG